MALEVARIIQDWLDDDAVKWEATTEVVDWARAYGADLERAWAECPRADFLMAIAGACGVDPEPIVRAASSAAREALAFVPAKYALTRKAVHLAESYRGGRDLPGAMDLTARTMALFDELEIEEGRLIKAAEGAAPRAMEALVERVVSFVSDPATHERLAASRDTALAGQIPQEIVASTALMLDEALKNKAVVTYGERTAARRRLIASAHGVRAAASSLVVAHSAQVAIMSTALQASILENERATNDALVRLDETARIARRSRARVYSEAALVFNHAAGAFGHSEATTEPAWRASILRLMTGMLNAAGSAELDPDERMAGSKMLDTHAEHAKTARLADFADRVRAAVPLSALAPPEDEADLDAAARRDPRGALLQSLTALTPLLRFLDEPGAADAGETALAILRATGPFNKKALAPALQTLHERMAAMFRERTRTVTGDARDEARAATAGAEDAVRELAAVLATLDLEKPS